jgi:hypothetical protein
MPLDEDFDPELLEEILSRPNLIHTLSREDEEEDSQLRPYEELPTNAYPSDSPIIQLQSEILKVPSAQSLFNEIARRPFTFETKQKLRDLILDVSDHLYQVTNYNSRRRELEYTMNDLTIAQETLIFSLPKIDITHHLNFILSLIDKMYFAAALCGVQGFARGSISTQILKKSVSVGTGGEEGGSEGSMDSQKGRRIRR